MSAIRLEGLNSVSALIADLGPGLERANERAQNKMAYNLMVAEREQAKSDLDRPVPGTLSSILYKKYGATSLSFSNPGYTVAVPGIKGAGVFVGDLYGKTLATTESVLGVQIEGGPPAGPKRSAKILQQFRFMPAGKVWVPALGAPLDAYGNLRGSLISFMLQNMGTNPYAPVTDDNKFLLMGEPGDEYGIYWKGSTSAAQKGGAWRPLLWFINPPTYSKRYKWNERADTEVAAQFNGILAWYVDDELARMAG
jgi:hypothetical protein